MVAGLGIDSHLQWLLPTLPPAMGDDGDDNQNVFYASSSSNGTADGIKFNDEDVLLFSAARKRWVMVIDGSDIGLELVDIDAFHPRSPEILSQFQEYLSFLQQNACSRFTDGWFRQWQY